MRTKATLLALLICGCDPSDAQPTAPPTAADAPTVTEEPARPMVDADPDVAGAVAAAEAWLELVDEGEHGESWEAAAAYFKGAVTAEQWSQQLAAVREPLGDVQSRQVDSTQHLTSVPGGPDGEYVVIQFGSSFANKARAVETVTPMRDPDGTWRVSGYYIK